METVRDNPLTLAAKRNAARENAAQEEARRKVPPGFNKTTLGRAARVMAPMNIEFDFIRKAAKVNETANGVVIRLADLTQGNTVLEREMFSCLNELSTSLSDLLLSLDLVRNMIHTENGYAEAARTDRGGLQAFFSVYMAAANELEKRTRALEAARGQAPPPIDPDAPTYTKYEILELAARMAAEAKQRSDIDGGNV